jgi:hypothetical protein
MWHRLAAALLIVSLTGCDSEEAEFAAASDFLTSRYAARAPTWFPSNATDIKLKVSSDGHFIMRFSFFRPPEFFSKLSTCQRTQRPYSVEPRVDASWWPFDIQAPLATYLEFSFNCGQSGILLIRGLPEKAVGYFWN